MELTEQEAKGLDSLKARMTKTQRQEMAEIIQKEMERRGMVEPRTVPENNMAAKKSTVKAAGINGGMSTDQVKELYEDVGQAVQQLRIKKLEAQLGKAKRTVSAPGMREPKMRQSRPAEQIHSERAQSGRGIRDSEQEYRPRGGALKYMMMYGVCGLGILKVVSATGIFDSTIAKARPTVEAEAQQSQLPEQIAMAAAAPQETISVATQGHLWSTAEKDVLTQLDARRVELEHRREALDRREQELKNQAQTVTERLAELRGLTSKLQELRKERETKQEGRLAQLANVYGGMDPTEAAHLISRLEDPIALELLERMPEKRMGQVLGVMEQARAIDLTKLLSEKRVIN